MRCLAAASAHDPADRGGPGEEDVVPALVEQRRWSPRPRPRPRPRRRGRGSGAAAGPSRPSRPAPARRAWPPRSCRRPARRPSARPAAGSGSSTGAMTSATPSGSVWIQALAGATVNGSRHLLRAASRRPRAPWMWRSSDLRVADVGGVGLHAGPAEVLRAGPRSSSSSHSSIIRRRPASWALRHSSGPGAARTRTWCGGPCRRTSASSGAVVGVGHGAPRGWRVAPSLPPPGPASACGRW